MDVSGQELGEGEMFEDIHLLIPFHGRRITPGSSVIHPQCLIRCLIAAFSDNVMPYMASSVISTRDKCVSDVDTGTQGTDGVLVSM